MEISKVQGGDHESSSPGGVEYESAIDFLAEALVRLGFKETEKLRDSKRAVAETLAEEANSDRARETWDDFTCSTESIVDDTIEPDDTKGRGRMHIAMLLYSASLFREVNQYARYVEELLLAYDYAYNIAPDVAVLILQEIDTFSLH